jgi:hypothetical protein
VSDAAVVSEVDSAESPPLAEQAPRMRRLDTAIALAIRRMFPPCVDVVVRR